MDIFASVVLFLSGVGIFLIGMKLMGEHLESNVGKSLRRLFDKLNNNRVAGVGIGIGTTVLTQSSSATTVMIVGFASAGIMSLTQATSIIMGANIGTTITTQLIALKFLGQLFSVLGFVGALMMMLGKNKVKSIGTILAGVGMIFIGMELMGSGFDGIKQEPAVIDIFNTYGDNPIIMFLAGLLITMIIQSSAGTTGIVMSCMDVIGLGPAFYALIGANIGTCITAVLASFGSNVHGKRVAVMHTLFNCIGAILFIIPLSLGWPLADWLIALFPGVPATQVAMFHTFFNVSTTLILLVFVKPLSALVAKILPESKKDRENALRLQYLNDNMLTNGPIAVAQVRKELVGMANLARENLGRASEALMSVDTREKETFEQIETKINFLNKEITKFLVKLASLELSEHDDTKIGTYYHVVTDIERIGDYAENVFEYAEKAKEEDITFSNEAREEMKKLFGLVDKQLEVCINAFAESSLADRDDVEAREDELDDFVIELQDTHVRRLNEGICTPVASSIFLSLTANMERVGDHTRNIYLTMKDYVKDSQNVVVKAVK